MSVTELFSQRYQARIGCGDLFLEDLHLHDYRAVEQSADETSETPASRLREHVQRESDMREQVKRAIGNVNEQRAVKDLPRRAAKRMADAYQQRSEHALSEVAMAGLDWLFEYSGQPPAIEPVKDDPYGLPANLLVFDFVEMFFDLLPGEEQLDFSRDLNARLQQGQSRWYFQLGRWRRNDWPHDRDSQFDHILLSLKLQSDAALRRKANLESSGESVAFDPQAAAAALKEAARRLWEADQLLSSDLLSDKIRHAAAVRAARQAFDACLKSFGGVVRGPFVRAKPPREPRRRFGIAARRSETPAKGVMKGPEEPLAAAYRIKRLGEALAQGHGIERAERLKLLERANLAEFVMRLVLFGLPPDKPDADDAESDEVRRYSRLTRTETPPAIGGRKLGHGEGSLHLQLQDKATARLAVDLMARLSQFATGAATSHPEGDMAGELPAAAFSRHPRQADLARQIFWRRVGYGALLLICAAGLVGLGLIAGTRL
ncbi:hypothetical protein F1654_02100 [Alkalicaulis satelles]|uniref:Uncharacterized protein n=1 Tax=Alkalicaulis satelles TaxID=2609175 RepID=A0A5M6ZJ25_9PROT|nr:hypothetical protein [Alkalicaulis satelles]KAA5804813.1 hypothetical protein F1654_02100 [Alkalicaulis satelles]